MNFTDFLLNDPLIDKDKLFLLGKEDLSYGNLILEVQNLSIYINEKYGKDKNIILCSPNNIFFIISYLAIIKSGNICIPIDPAISHSNFNFIIQETTPIIFISKSSKLNIDKQSSFNEDDLNIIVKKTDFLLDFSSESHSDKVAVILFTSGSTGKPKGVMLTHLNLKANTLSIIEYLKIDNKDRVLVVMPFYYCYGLSLMHTHLKCKGSIVINSSFIFLGGVLNDLLKFKCTGFAGVPSHFQILLRKTTTFIKTDFPDLRYVTQAGGKLNNSFIQEFVNTFKKIDFFLMYGQTEATARLSYLPPKLLNSKIGSIGKGIPGVTLKVVDQNFNPIKPGETGEIVAKGDNIMKGYYHDEELTKQTLYNGWLKTGDLATIDEDGFIFLLARAKEIIKIRGKRINPKEIEDVITMIPEVIDCSIYSIEDQIEGESMEAKIVLRDDSLIDENYIKNFCYQYLELYKIPSRIIFQKKMEISSSGKKLSKNQG